MACSKLCISLLGAMAAAWLVVSPLVSAFVGPARSGLVGYSSLRGAGASPAEAPRWSGEGQPSGGVSAVTLAAAAAVALALGASRSRARARGLVAREGIHGGPRDPMWFTKLSKEDIKEQGVIFKPYFRQKGVRAQKEQVNWPDEDLVLPARMSLGRIYEAVASYTVSDFYMAPSASLDFSDVKEVGSYMVKPGETEATTPAKLPEYVGPKPHVRLEQDKGAKRPPLADDAYIAHVDRMTNLADMAAKVVPSSTSKDFIMDRRAMITLLDYLNHDLTKTLNTCRPSHAGSSVDLVKISKSPSGGLVVDALYDRTNLIAEGIPYNGCWFRTERSHAGSYFNAYRRHATGGKQMSIMCTGLRQIAGNSAGEEPESFRFTEFELGGLKFLMRAPAHCVRDGKSVELGTTHWVHQDNYTLLRTYHRVMFGKVDMFSLAVQGSGKLREVVEKKPEDLVAKNPEIKECADKRYGRLVDLLKKVSGAISGDGPWVLQWQAGELKLGKYEVTEDPDKVDEEEEEKEEVIMA